MKFSFTRWFSGTCKQWMAAVAFLGMTSLLSAQVSCPYTLVLTDDFGDGWFGGQLVLESNGVEQIFALQFGTFEETISFTVVEGEPIVLTWLPGFFNGDEGIATFQAALDANNPFEAICLDIMMPKVDGHEALTKIREIEEKQGRDTLDLRAKVIMTTALGDSKSVLGSFREGCVTLQHNNHCIFVSRYTLYFL